MVQAVFIDFYGTVVHEDGEVIRKISQEIFDTGKVRDRSEIGAYWWNEFQTAFLSAYGDNFETQRELEYQSLDKTLQYFNSTADAKILSNKMFEHWIKPPIFEESKQFFEMCPVPVYIVSNIDRDDILKAIEFHGLRPMGVFTSEDAKSYKPRKELFEFALRSTGLSAEQVVHIGDSMSSDIKGASSVGINAVWINRSDREVPDGVSSVRNLLEVYDTDYFK
ncbi:HAD family hydrolase [Roseburia sp. 499]|uniref:HAD family hydrolase n=1 Tax=Roseburia sp. 499 TaxID=1261634 RepID=UPI0009536252|nr:HAD family hydrolase [Roseburia sp. 499]WVK68585.1 HAD family hydrolase [Roseburia sp. 499]